jgi:LuxR family maltose regulon positive regulatory protein
MPSPNKPISAQLLQTKFLAPAYNQNSVDRNQLLDRLRPRNARKLVLISAPAGYGKTTLVSQWLHHNDEIFCWLSLDAHDDKAERFWLYLVGSISSQIEGFGEEAAKYLALDNLHIDAAVTALVNELNSQTSESKPFYIILDDFHNIQDTSLLQQFSYFVDFLPPNIQLILTTRYEPKLPISRWSVKNWVDQIYSTDLMFTLGESKIFLNSYMGLSLNDRQIEKIHNKTEGWIAAIQLAALSANSTPQHEQAYLSPQQLFADDRHFSDYILSEILSQQSEHVQEFLIKTSCLLKLNAALCDFIMASDSSQITLEELYQANLFLIPLDKGHRWYRYHDLFRDALVNKLRLNYAEDYIALQKRAIEWLIQNEQAHEAIDQVVQLEDWELLMSLLEENGNNLIHEGHHLLVLDWLRKVPEKLTSQSPRAIMLKIWALFFSNRIEVISPLLEELEVLIDQQRLLNIETSADELIDLHSEISLIRAYLARSQSDLKSAGQLTKDVLKELDTTKMPLKSVTYYGLGLDSFAVGDLESAEAALIEAIEHGKREKKYTTVLSSSGLLGWIYFYQGKLEKALETGIINQQWIDSYHDSSQPRIISCWQNSALSIIYTEKAEFTIAQSYINPLLKHLEIGTEPGQHIIIQYTQAILHYAQKRYVDAIECIDDAWHVYQHKRDSIVFTPPSLIALKAKCLLAMNMVDKAEYVINELSEESINALPLNFEDINLTKARIFIAQNKTEVAIEILDRIVDQANNKNHVYHLIQTLNIKAACLLKLHDSAMAEKLIKESLLLASQDGFISVYANESALMLPVLALGADPSIPDAYLQKLTMTLGLQSEELGQQVELKGVAALESNKQLLEPLSQRELEVLGLIDQGLANKEIAQKLSLAPATVKAHIRNLYGKIEAKSRTEALSKARSIGLI